MTGYMYAYVHVGTHTHTHMGINVHKAARQRQHQLEVNSILGSMQHPNYDKDESGHQPGSKRCHFLLELEDSIRD